MYMCCVRVYVCIYIINKKSISDQETTSQHLFNKPPQEWLLSIAMIAGECGRDKLRNWAVGWFQIRWRPRCHPTGMSGFPLSELLVSLAPSSSSLPLTVPLSSPVLRSTRPEVPDSSQSRPF
uniref:Uncharacterized protein n=1 Tax=Rousettus aegyptiacus TaxID=9407 RepID=A0A7J8JGS3_ROUAE|nr:hypothetical protein HJG63_010325 [Rousettus aegyptiacus]